MSWTTPADLKTQIQKLWDSGEILSSIARGEEIFPRRLKLKCPTTKEYADDFEKARKWAENLRGVAQCRLELEEVNHRVLGKNVFPKQIWIDNLEQAISFIGRRSDLNRFKKLVELVALRQPQLTAWLARRPLAALQIHDRISLLLDTVEWLQARPRPEIYLRQVSIAGVHSKFIEANRNTLSEWLDIVLSPEAIDAAASGTSKFNQRYGFKDKPLRVRFRILDPVHNVIPGEGDQDITLDIASFAKLRPAVTTVFITENEINYLAFSRVPNAMVIFGAGYGLGALPQAQWLQSCRLFYWGDIDTHGFAILNSARTYFPRITSVLMDQETLNAHMEFWSVEPSQHGAQELAGLTFEEKALFKGLKNDTGGQSVRLEQELIDWEYAWARISEVCDA